VRVRQDHADKEGPEEQVLEVVHAEGESHAGGREVPQALVEQGDDENAEKRAEHRPRATLHPAASQHYRGDDAELEALEGARFRSPARAKARSTQSG
jgi:hypothetical protein